MNLTSTPATLTCSECDEEIEDAGYLPAIERGDACSPIPDAAVCNACGFNRIGFAGCAPELGDLVDPDTDTVLLRIRVTDAGIEPLGAKD